MGGGRGGCGVVCGVQVVPDGPADHAVPRMEKGDIVKLIDGVNVTSLAHAKSLILGEPGTQVGISPLLSPFAPVSFALVSFALVVSLCPCVLWICWRALGIALHLEGSGVGSRTVQSIERE